MTTKAIRSRHVGVNLAAEQFEHFNAVRKELEVRSGLKWSWSNFVRQALANYATKLAQQK